MRRLTIGSIILFAIRSTRSENLFLRPPGPGPQGDYRDNPTYKLGQQLDLQWKTDFEAIDLILWNDAFDIGKQASATITLNTSQSGMIWEVGYEGFPSEFDPALTPVYFIQMYEHGVTAAAATACHYFNITSAWASAAPNSTTAICLPPDSGSREKGFSNAKVAGIAVGAALGTFTVVCLAGWIAWGRLLKKRTVVEHSATSPVVGQSALVQSKHEMPSHNQQRSVADRSGIVRYELLNEPSAGNTRHEISGESVARDSEAEASRATSIVR